MRVVVGMSGGIDSCVAALLLKEHGYEVIGLTMKLWEDGSRCCSLEDIYNAKRVACKIGIPHYTVDFRESFKQEVVTYFVNEYLSGRTPNPCIVCNQRIKFGLFLNKSKEIGAEYIATGHYARVVKGNPDASLWRGKDKDKDQSYFLSMVTPESLGSSLFPLGEYTKDEVRRIGLELGIDKEESQEICFIPDGDYVEFIKKQAAGGKGIDGWLPGPIIDKAGNVIGQHKGIVNYTIGQRSGLGIPASTPCSTPLYVIGIQENAIIVGEEEDLLCKSLVVEGMNWLADVGLPLLCEVQVRYRCLPSKAVVRPIDRQEYLSHKVHKVIVEFEVPQKAISPGQLAVFYQGNRVIGGGWIASTRVRMKDEL